MNGFGIISNLNQSCSFYGSFGYHQYDTIVASIKCDLSSRKDVFSSEVLLSNYCSLLEDKQTKHVLFAINEHFIDLSKIKTIFIVKMYVLITSLYE